MKQQARDLLLAILTRIEEVEGTANRTKLLKLLYLADIEFFRATDDTLTGFEWIYYLYGPWSSEYDGLLKQLEAEAAIRLQPWAAGGVEGERITSIEEKQLERVIAATDVFFRTRRQIDTWADRAVPRLLDYVYFETEPMQGATKMERLDFRKVSKQPPRLYRRTKSGSDTATLRKLRSKFADLSNETVGRGAWESISHTPAQFDETYLAALAEFEREEQ
jgi:Antitoxin SocA-like, Panacea domain